MACGVGSLIDQVNRMRKVHRRFRTAAQVSNFTTAPVIGRRDLLLSEWNVMAAMSMMQSHAAHFVSGGGERRRRSAAERRSITRIVLPHIGQRHELERGSRVVDKA
jgi:hypothetical protein